VSDNEKGNLANMERKLEEDTVCAENCEACKRAIFLSIWHTKEVH
jgi:hypothetical protein